MGYTGNSAIKAYFIPVLGFVEYSGENKEADKASQRAPKGSATSTKGVVVVAGEEKNRFAFRQQVVDTYILLKLV